MVSGMNTALYILRYCENLTVEICHLMLRRHLRFLSFAEKTRHQHNNKTNRHDGETLSNSGWGVRFGSMRCLRGSPSWWDQSGYGDLL